jgi:hypothetical protein
LIPFDQVKVYTSILFKKKISKSLFAIFKLGKLFNSLFVGIQVFELAFMGSVLNG